LTNLSNLVILRGVQGWAAGLSGWMQGGSRFNLDVGYNESKDGDFFPDRYMK